jgi:protein-S-isoprenylcysteine O-methyltransferase Ste14
VQDDGVALLVDQEAGARAVIYLTLAAGVTAEVVATHRRRGNVREAFALGTRKGAGSIDRGTKQVLILAMVAGVVAAALLAREGPALRAGANTWGTLALGACIVWLGIGLRVWAVWSLGRFFRREVTIEADQTVVESGPYRWVRHPAYTGDLLIAFGFGLTWGSWVGAAVALVVAFAGHLPRIRVEEAALREAFGDAYESYARRRARLVPGIW